MNATIETFTFTTDRGIPFTFVKQPAGVALERNPGLPYAPPTDEVAVYDARYSFTPWGQFVASYGTEVFTGRSTGIAMDLAFDAWTLDDATVAAVSEWLAAA